MATGSDRTEPASGQATAVCRCCGYDGMNPSVPFDERFCTYCREGSHRAGPPCILWIPCPACRGAGCEEGCGRCESAYAGPESHRICRSCDGFGMEPNPEPLVDAMARAAARAPEEADRG